MTNNTKVVVNGVDSTSDKLWKVLGSVISGVLAFALILILPAFFGGWLFMLLLGILNLNVAIGVPALGYLTSVAIWYLLGSLFGLRTVGKTAAEELKKKKA